jgi:hypothetical protein
MDDDLDIRDEAGKSSRPVERAPGTTLLYSLGLGVLGFTIIAIGIIGAFAH